MTHADDKETFPKREERILRFWQEHHLFQKSVENRTGKPIFSFYDGPPFATGLPHYGHLLAGTIKDVIPRYKTMKGYYVPRRFGWDCHGLPIENEIEKAKGLSGAKAIEKFGIAHFNEECRNIVLRYTGEWKTTVDRMGRWVDFSHTYRTMDLSFMESVWWVFKRLHDLGLIYKGYKVMPFSAKLGTPLSNFEASENYKEVDDPSLTVLFKVIDEENSYFLVWTTTPWTLISNLAISVGQDIDYVTIHEKATGRKITLAEARLKEYFKDEAAYDIVQRQKGTALKGKKYEPLFSHFAKQREKGAFQVIEGDFVTLEEGTGLVHTAPGFGEQDFYACQQLKLPVVCPVDQNGQFTNEVPEYEGRFVKDCDKEIIKHLKHEGKVFHQGTCRHRYPFCWRSDTPLIYKAVSTWFVNVEKIKDKLISANDQIYWMPEHIKYGRFGKWLENARDWAISRNRYWGTPIPIWESEDGEIRVLGSIKDLEEKTGAQIADLHRQYIDDLTFVENGKTFRRIFEVFDCWFESGAMPYAQGHYPFENKELFEKTFPADFIGEGLDQTRGWFYTLTVLSAALFDKPAFKNVIVNGIVLAEDGAKMSKRLKNYPDPLEIVNTYGADALRLYMISSPAVRADDLCFAKNGVEGVLKQVLLPLWNSYTFFNTYAKLYQWKPTKGAVSVTQDLDKYLLSLTGKLVEETEAALEKYDLNGAAYPLVDFVEQLTNWYIRRSRRRFWNDDNIADRNEAFSVLYRSLMTCVKAIAPLVPFMAEAIYQHLKTDEDLQSVHLCDYPTCAEFPRDLDLEMKMRNVQEIVSLGHAIRKEHTIKVRQPLAKAFVVAGDVKMKSDIKACEALIADELNVDAIVIVEDEEAFVERKIKPNFRVLGKKIGKFMKTAQARIESFSKEEIATLESKGSLSITIEGEPVTLTTEDVAIERHAKEGVFAQSSKKATVALDLALTEDLLQRGIAREFINRINTLRKELGFEISDRIHLQCCLEPLVQTAVEKHKEFISQEVLALSIAFGPCAKGSEIEINDTKGLVTLTKQ